MIMVIILIIVIVTVTVVVIETVIVIVIVIVRVIVILGGVAQQRRVVLHVARADLGLGRPLRKLLLCYHVTTIMITIIV